MLQRFSNHIDQKFPFLKGKKILIAISGGIDSVVLTHLLYELKFNISLAHCNFNLRNAESDLDEDFVTDLAKKLQITCFTTSFETTRIAKENKESTQIAARNLRYNWFQEIVSDNNFDYVFTGHHADDNLETFLINLTRGSGLDGFTGIPEINGNIVRPFLSFSREEIINYAQEQAISWREDLSNASTKYVRNKIRHHVLPVLKEINPSLLETFSKTIENLQESKQIIEDRVKEVSNAVLIKEDKTENLKLDIKKIKNLSNPKAYLFQLLGKYNFTEFNDIYSLISAQSGKQVFSKTHVLLKDRDFLILSKRDFSIAEEITFQISDCTTEIKKPIHLTFEEVSEKIIQHKSIIYVSKKSLKFPLIVRKWQNGDYFYPSGMKGKKKLSKYFKDEKLSLLEKKNLWLLCNNDGAIIWIIDRRQDSRFEQKENAVNIKIALAKA